MLFLGKKSRNLALIECSSGSTSGEIKFPFSVGNTPECDFNIKGEQSASMKVTFSLLKSTLVCVPSGANTKVLIDSNRIRNSTEITADTLHSLQVGNALFFFYFGKNPESELLKIDMSSWNLFNAQAGESISMGVDFKQLRNSFAENADIIEQLAISPNGLSIGFWVRDIIDDLDSVLAESTPAGRAKQNTTVTRLPSGSEYFAPNLDEESGSLTCPSCWLKFNPEDVNFIAVHGSLRGDPLMGEDEQLRFLPTKYNSKGVPLDPMGVPSHAMACPHCHRRLPSAFLQMKGHIMSLVGAPSSGKSYFLSILLHFLPNILFKYYNTAFIDADPPLNAVINVMKNKLFAISDSQEHYLSKTQLEGAMYERLVRHGKMVSLPKPFVYILRDMQEFSNQASLTFYDNAGEHFEPGISIEDSPGALHVASADALMFLFDPLVSTNIKLKLNPNIDPQLLSNSIDQQDVILAEMANRIKQIKNIENAYDLNTPFSFMVNKCDAIEPLFNAREELEDPIREGVLDNDIIDRNSAKIRSFLLDYAPNVVINAEMISRNIKYFMMSPFGHSPKEYIKEDSSKYIMPDPSLINPIFIEAPVLWALSQMPSVPLHRLANKTSVDSRYIF